MAGHAGIDGAGGLVGACAVGLMFVAFASRSTEILITVVCR